MQKKYSNSTETEEFLNKSDIEDLLNELKKIR